MSTLGWIHMIFGLVALLAGTLVILIRKGGRWHRTLGHVYLTSMVSLNVTGLFIYNLYGRFGPFHWMAVSSLLILTGGMVPVFTRRPRGRWLELHALLINISFIGLAAATAAEVASRIPAFEDAFGPVVGVTSVLVIAAGAALMHRYMPHSLRRTPVRFQQSQ